MPFFESVISLIITLGILVTIHEYGHFWVARKCGVKVLRFSVGFGRPIYSWHDKTGTEFAIASIPLGGYVKMLDEREGPVEEAQKPYAFNNKSVRQRIAIVAAGPLANFIFAIFAYWLMFLLGFNTLIPTIGQIDADSIAHQAGLKAGQEIIAVDGRETLGWRAVNMELINRIGDTGSIEMHLRSDLSNNIDLSGKNGISDQAETSPFVVQLEVENWMVDVENTSLIKVLGIHPKKPMIPAIIDKVLVASPAEQGGMLPGDKVVTINGIAIDDWFGLVDIIKDSGEKLVLVEVERIVGDKPEIVSLNLRPEIHVGDDGQAVGRLGVSVKPFEYPEDMIRNVSLGVFEAIPEAIGQTWADTKMTLSAIKKMLLGLISLENLSGPITIAQVASESIKSGTEEFLRFLALLSVSLGVLNLLPIPVLDGGHLLYYLVESIRGKPVSEKWQTIGLKIGVSFILVLMTLAMYNDLMRL